MISSDPQLNLGIFAFLKDTADVFDLGFYEKSVISAAGQFDGFSFDDGCFADHAFFPVRYRPFDNQLCFQANKTDKIKSRQGIKRSGSKVDRLQFGIKIGILSLAFFPVEFHHNISSGGSFELIFFIQNRVGHLHVRKSVDSVPDFIKLIDKCIAAGSQHKMVRFNPVYGF